LLPLYKVIGFGKGKVRTDNIVSSVGFITEGSCTVTSLKLGVNSGCVGDGVATGVFVGVGVGAYCPLPEIQI